MRIELTLEADIIHGGETFVRELNQIYGVWQRFRLEGEKQVRIYPKRDGITDKTKNIRAFGILGGPWCKRVDDYFVTTRSALGIWWIGGNKWPYRKGKDGKYDPCDAVEVGGPHIADCATCGETGPMQRDVCGWHRVFLCSHACAVEWGYNHRNKRPVPAEIDNFKKHRGNGGWTQDLTILPIG